MSSEPVAPALAPAEDAAIERFNDALWIEDGLATLTLAAYRRDLALMAQSLQAQPAAPLLSACTEIRPAGLHGNVRPGGGQDEQCEPAAVGVQALLPLGRCASG